MSEKLQFPRHTNRDGRIESQCIQCLRIILISTDATAIR